MASKICTQHTSIIKLNATANTCLSPLNKAIIQCWNIHTKLARHNPIDRTTTTAFLLNCHADSIFSAPIFVDTKILKADPIDSGTININPNRRSEEHTSELQSRENLVCRLLL